MRRKIFLYYLILILIGMCITGFFTSELAQRIYIQEVKNKLITTARLIQSQISDNISKGINVDYNDTAIRYSKILDQSVDANNSVDKTVTRITFVDFSGKVVGESETNYQGMENHLERKEIQEAIKGGIGEDVRTSKTLKTDFLYIALPIPQSKIVARVSVPLVQVRNIDKIIWFYAIIGILAGLVLTLILAIRFSSSIIGPINELMEVSQAISKGDYSKRAKIRSKDELGQLSEAFNEMSIKLESTIAELMDKNVKVDSIINSMTSGIVAVDTEYRILMINSIASEIFGIKHGPGVIGINILELIRNNRINAFLKETIEKNVPLVKEVTIGQPENRILRVHTTPIKSMDAGVLNSGGIASIQDITGIKKLEQIRTEFVSNVTHELKTPLTSIRGFIETLRNGAIDDREVAEKFLEIIDIEAERLSTLINDILQLSEIESKHKDSNIGTYNLKSIVSEILSILQGSAEKKGIVLIDDVADGIIITANRDRIKQMLINLVDNGIKYNKENGSVAVQAHKVGGKLVISVKDTGIGIAEEHIQRIFERFYRVDKGRSRSMGGTGLGLSIVKHIVNLYNGDIKVNSTPGKGTEFVIQLPV